MPFPLGNIDKYEMEPMKSYDIFISYRRTSYDTANLIATRLRAAGYSVFFDMESLRSGKFNEQLFDVIDNCKDFILVLPPDALDRCVNEDDWVRLEVCRAMAGKKNIVPVMLNGFTWPDPMPFGMEDLADYQALTATSTEYFDMAMERLQKRYLLSRRRMPVVRMLKYAGAVLAILIAVLAIFWGTFRWLSRDVCQKYATMLANDAGYVYTIVEENHRLRKDWEEFDDILNYETRPDRIAELKQNMEDRINQVQTNLQQTWMADSAKMNISPYHSFLLSLHRINAEEIAVSPQYATLFYTDYLDQLISMRNAVNEPTALNRRLCSVLFEVNEHSANSYYASLLSELSQFPESSRTTYKELSSQWIHFPVHLYKIDEDREYYENIVNTENRLASEEISRYESALERRDAELDDLDRRSQDLERLVEESLSGIQKQLSTATETAQQEAEVALRREMALAKEVEIQTLRDELEELNRQYEQTYEDLKQKCILESDDDQWYQWGKIIHWGHFLALVSEGHKEQASQGMMTTSSVTPERTFSDMDTLLDDYLNYHPESKDYIASARQFFKEVSDGEREYSGVLIFAFKDDLIHPLFQKGDIVIGYAGQQIKNYNDFKSAYQVDKTGKVTFLRMVDGKFDAFEHTIVDIDIVGFIELTEEQP